jgi:hypothetical protein
MLSAQAYAGEIDLREIIAHPQTFDGKEITTKGLAALGGIGGNALYLYPDFDTAAKGAFDVHHAAYVPDKLMKFRSFTMEDHRCWFAVTGIVRARRHGPWGDNPCEIEIKSIRNCIEKKGCSGRRTSVCFEMQLLRQCRSTQIYLVAVRP